MENTTLTSYVFSPCKKFIRYFHVLRNNCIFIEFREIKESIHNNLLNYQLTYVPKKLQFFHSNHFTIFSAILKQLHTYQIDTYQEFIEKIICQKILSIKKKIQILSIMNGIQYSYVIYLEIISKNISFEAIFS